MTQAYRTSTKDQDQAIVYPDFDEFVVYPDVYKDE